MKDYGIFDFLQLIGSLGIFIYGMKVMSEAIQKIAGKSLRLLLKKLTDNRFAGWFTGFVTTAIIQSSSATTVMVVSFVNAGLLTVTQSIGVIMGANFGTTVTSWLISFFGFGDFKITEYALPLIAIGFPLLFASKKRRQSTGEFLFGFGLLFIGLQFMKDSVPDLKSDPTVLSFLANFANHGFLSTILFVFVGTLLTVVVQSSSAAMSITLVMVAQGWVPIEVGASMVLGENIGTTITAYLASLIGNVNAKRAARAHMIFNLIGVAWMILIIGPFLQFIDYLNMLWFGFESVFTASTLEKGAAMPKALSLFHSIFNMLNAILLIGFVPLIEKIVIKLVPEKIGGNGIKMLGRNQLIETPELAIFEARSELYKMGGIAKNMLDIIRAMFVSTDKDLDAYMKKLNEGELNTDQLEIEISAFLMDVAERSSSSQASIEIIKMLEVSDELESVGDIALQIGAILQRKQEEDVHFGNKMNNGITEMLNLLDEAVIVMNKNLDQEYDEISFEAAEKLEAQINLLREELQNQNLVRMGKKEEKVHSAILFRDLFNSLEKLGDKIFLVSKALSKES